MHKLNVVHLTGQVTNPLLCAHTVHTGPHTAGEYRRRATTHHAPPTTHASIPTFPFSLCQVIACHLDGEWHLCMVCEIVEKLGAGTTNGVTAQQILQHCTTLPLNDAVNPVVLDFFVGAQ